LARAKSRLSATVVAIVLFGLGRPARADAKADAVLRYTRGDGAERCPDEAALREAVLVHLGYDPFVAQAPRAIVVDITKRGRGLTARIDRLDEHGAVVGTRSVESSSTGCKELASSVVLAVSIAVDPLHGTPNPSEPDSPASRPPEARLAPAPATSDAPPQAPARASTKESAPLRTSVSAGVVAGLGVAPSPSVGLAGEARLRVSSLSVGAGIRVDAPASAAASGDSGGRVQSSRIVGTFVPCVHLGFFAGCGSMELGALSGEAAEVARSERHSTFFSAVGGRATVTLPLGTAFAMGVFGEALAVLTPTTLRIDRREAWSTSPVSGTLGLLATANLFR
jgi:hypothetical protein